jgi:hypothetical protein
MRTQAARLRSLTLSLSVALIAALALLVAVPQPGVQAQEDFRTLKRKYEDAKKDAQRVQMERAVTEMGATADPKAAKFLLDELDQDQRDRSRNCCLPHRT